MPAELATLERQLKVYKGLVEVSALINAITDSKELLPAIMEVARRVLEVEASSLFLVNPQGELELASSSGGAARGAQTTQRIVVPRGRGISGWVLENRQPLLVPDAYADERFFKDADRLTGFTTRSILSVPLLRGDKEIGVLQVLNPIGRTAFDEVDLELLAAYGTLAATAIDKLRTIERQHAQERIRQEYAFAQEIQKSFLPQTLPQHSLASFAAFYRPALNVGGDFYDVIEPAPGEIYFVVGDVSGKGMPAALLMAQALSILRLIVKPGISPIAAMARWNSMLVGHTIRGMFITALLGRIDVESRHIELCSAGHCNPIRVPVAGPPVEVKVAGSPPLGLLAEIPARSQTITLEPRESLVAYTDGLTESYDPNDQFLDREGVFRLLTRAFHNPAEIVDALNLGELQHRQQGQPSDDLTLLAFLPAMKREIEFASHPANLSLVRDFVRQFLRPLTLSETEKDLIVLGLDEACTNVIRYAYHQQTNQLIALICQQHSDRVVFQLRDYGKQCKPEQLQGRPLDLVQPGGLGIHLIRRAFDQVDYNLKRQGTELVLVKNLPAETSAAN